MRIEKVIISNYRQYKNLEIVFTSKKLQLITGIMGTGKTNFLNAINWCLYNDEPYLSKSSQQLPLINLKTIDEGKEKEVKDVFVELRCKIDEKKPIVFTRTAHFLIVNNNGKNEATTFKSTEFEVKVMDNQGNFDLIIDDEAEYYVQRFVPSKVKEFFFFDGERLDRYFREATGQNIRHAIFQISQTALLKKMGKNLDKIKKDYNKDAGKASPDIENNRAQLENQEKQKTEAFGLMEECKKQIKISKDKIEELKQKLKDIPDVGTLQKKREELKISRKENEQLQDKKIEEKNEILFDFGKLLYLYPSIHNSIEIIRKKKEMGELPPTGDRELLKNILYNKFCSICGRPFSEGSKEERSVKELLSGINLSTEAATTLQEMRVPLLSFQEKLLLFKEKTEEISAEIKKYSKDFDNINQEIEKIEKQISGFNEEKIRSWYQELKSFEKINEQNLRSLGMHEKDFYKAENEYNKLKIKLNEEISKVEKIGDIKKKIDFIDQALEAIDTTQSIVMEQIRKKISLETDKKFFDLMWKKETFKKVLIDEDFEIHLIHNMDYDCLGTISGGEREVLALSFTMALHSISGFDAPILIDRPLAMVSGPPREHIAKILLNLAKEKQLILFLTPDDYKDVTGILNSQSCNMYELNLSKDENEIKMEEL